MTLDELMDEADGYMHSILLKGKSESLIPSFMVNTPQGRLVIIAPGDMNDSTNKHFVAHVVRTKMLEMGATAYAFMSEAWMVVRDFRPGKEEDLSFAPDRMEIVQIIGGDKQGKEATRIWKIIRDDKGNIIGLDRDEDLPSGSIGKWSNMLVEKSWH